MQTTLGFEGCNKGSHSLPFSLKFMQGLPEEVKTTWLGIACVLNPKALQPLGALGSQVT
ncbi:hypothetical protein ACX93W_19490 [Paenibacillus sp. CAU 1782]